MTTEPVLPPWLVDACKNFTDEWVPVSRMPGVPGPVQVSPLGLVAAAYVAGWNTARDEFAAGVPEGARIIAADQWEMLRSVLWDATGWRPAPAPAAEVAMPEVQAYEPIPPAAQPSIDVEVTRSAADQHS